MLDGSTLVIVPTFNEIESLPILIAGVMKVSPGVDILVVDDNSPDGTGNLADELSRQHKRVHVLHRDQKNGLGPAYLAGFDWGLTRGYGYLVEMDADGSHQPIDLPKLLAAKEHADLVIGSRWVKGGKVENWPLRRKLISRCGNLYANVLLNAGIHDITAGFRVYSSELLRALPLNSIAAQGYSFQVEMAWRSSQAGAKIVEIPITFVERVHGSSKMGMNIVLEALVMVTKWGMTRLVRG